MNGNEIRSRFFKYFADKGHTIVESSSLVPHDDPALLFANAGMNQFKRVFMGEEHRDYVRAVTSQRCVRAGGKHNDLENVGYTARHHTFFEMLGNFSFGDYFKREAIAFAWEFLTKELGIDPKQLWVSVYQDDDEAFALWEEVKELPAGRIVRLGAADNFWAMGDTGPCGPCSEIHIDLGPEVGCDRPDCAVGCDCDRYLELWNLVFMQFYRDETGTMTPLPKPSIDTGLGLERVAAVLQGKFNNFDSDLFRPIITQVERQSGKQYGSSRKVDVAMRVIADHARATTFLVADGVLPANEGRGYVLRRIMRRAIRYGRTLGLTEPFLAATCATVADSMQEAYPHLNDARSLLDKIVNNEENRFGETLDHGLGMLEAEIARLQKEGKAEQGVAGDFIFKLYDTYGFPVDIVRDIALEKGISFDQAGFEQAMENARELSRRQSKSEQFEELPPGIVKLLEQGKQSSFVGYESRTATSVVEAIVDEQGNLIDKAASGRQVQLFCPRTPFYAEAGGQVGDRGLIRWQDGSFSVQSTSCVAEGLILHKGVVEEGTLATGQEVAMEVADSRTATALCHTATHLLHAAMKQVLGDHVKQAGSLVRPDRLRFDFTHFAPLTPEELERVEDLVNQRIWEDHPVETRVTDLDSAIELGAMALFDEKYEDKVRLVMVGEFSKELCAGTHVNRTGNIGMFKITHEGGVAAGIRRIEAVARRALLNHIRVETGALRSIGELLKAPAGNEVSRVERLLAQTKELEREISRLKDRLASQATVDVLSNVKEIQGVKVIAVRMDNADIDALRSIADKLRQQLGTAAVLIASAMDKKAVLLCALTRDLLERRLHAGELVKAVAPLVGGGGGGLPDMAQAGGKAPENLDKAMDAFYRLVEERLTER